MSFKSINTCILAVSCLIFISVSLSPVHAQSCVDSDGDGWGWDGSASCVVDSQSGDGVGSLTCVDPDGDGWGWDGVASCVVSDQTPETDDNTPTGGSDECIDSDGDGWGWGANGSCIADSNPQNDDPNETDNPITISGTYDQSKDLIALHYDHAPDPDDGHATAAAFVVQDQLSLAVQVVAGTYGEYSADGYLSASEPLMNSIWGSNWLNAHSNKSSAQDQAAIRWAGALAAGGDVWVAEGGPSDFTAGVVRLIQQQYPEFQTRSRIHVVQHSQWNEDHALASDLSYVKANTNYIRIEDGNEPNSTADFREFRQSFVDSALASAYSSTWRAAFDYLSPYEKLDFSDTVELLYILGIGTSQIANADDFASVFF